MPQRVDHRVLPALVAVLGVAVTVLGVRDPGTSGERRSAAAEPSAWAAVDGPAAVAEFCAGLARLEEEARAARSGPGADGGTSQTTAALVEQGRDLRELGVRLPVPRPVRAGLAAHVGALIGETFPASGPDAAAFSQFLIRSCPLA